MDLDMQTVSNKSLSGNFLQCKLYRAFFWNKIPNFKFIIFLFNIYSSFLMPLDSGRFPRKHAKYTIVLENTAGCQQTFSWWQPVVTRLFASDNRLSADTS